MAISSILMIVLIAVGIAWASLYGGKLPKPFSQRSCQGRVWRRSFPAESRENIRSFLSVFTDSFAFDDREKLKLNPNDQLLDIYRALYPHKWQAADVMEFETLSDDLQRIYGLDFGSVWREGLTLGQLFEHVQGIKK